MGFDRYMQLALHDPAVGYYHGDHAVIGKEGDFVTVPETSAHLAYCLAHACAGLIRDNPGRSILEIGAGTGQLALDMIRYLLAWEQLPRRYCIHEASETMRSVQRMRFESQAPEIIPIVEWLPEMPAELDCAIVIANEVLDALPVKCFAVDPGRLQERCVTTTGDGKLDWCLQAPCSELDTALGSLMASLPEPLAAPYCSEICLVLENALANWSGCCRQCVMFLIDYGYPCSEYYHPQRNMGTLRSYLRHRVSSNPLRLSGIAGHHGGRRFLIAGRGSGQAGPAGTLLWLPAQLHAGQRPARLAALRQGPGRARGRDGKAQATDPGLGPGRTFPGHGAGERGGL